MSVFQHTLDPSGAVGVLGDWVCLKTDGTVTRAITSALTTYGAVYGCIVVGGNPGTSVSVLTEGAVPPSISGLAALSGKARVNGSTARAERVASLVGSDYPIGDIDSSGTVEFGNEPASVASRTQLKAVSTPKHGSYVYVVDAGVHFVFSATDTATANEVTVLAVDDGTRGRWTLTTYQPSVGDEMWVPAGSTVATFNAAVQAAAALAASTGRKQTVRLEAGVYEAQAGESWQLARSRVAVEGAGAGKTILRAASAPNISLADDRTNCLAFGAGVERTDILSTVLTTAISPGGVAWFGSGTRKVSVNSLGTLAAQPNGGVGMWLAIGGCDVVGLNQGGQSGSNYRSRELIRVASTQTSPERITFEWVTKKHHSIAASGPGGTGETPYVVAVEPVEDFEIRGITFESTSHAVGLRLDDVARFVLEDLEFKGFTRSPVECFGYHDANGHGLKFESCHGGVYLRGGDVSEFNFETSTGGSRRHPLGGYDRGAWWPEHGVSHAVLRGCKVRHRAAGIHWRGFGGGCAEYDCTIDDIDMGAATNPPPNSAIQGAWDSGSGEGPDDEHAFGLIVRGSVIRNVRFPSTEGQNIDDLIKGSANIHDATRLDIEMVIEAGLSDQTTIDGDANYRTFGWVTQDAAGRLAIKVFGGQYEACVRSAAGHLVLDGCEYHATPNSGANSNVSLVLYWAPNVEIRNHYGQGYLWFGTPYGTNPTPYALAVTGTLNQDGYVCAGPMRVALLSGTIGNDGDVVAYDAAAPAGTTRVKVPAASTDQVAIVVGRRNLSGFPDGTYGLVRPPGGGVQAQVNGATTAGQVLDLTIGQKYFTPVGSKGAASRAVALETTTGAGVRLVTIEVLQ